MGDWKKPEKLNTLVMVDYCFAKYCKRLLVRVAP